MKNDRAYNNVDFIPDGAAYPDTWADDARAYREVESAVGRARLNEAYGPGERQKMDVFYPSGKPEGLVVFVHGGYWLRFDRTHWSHFATGLTARGWVVAMPSYSLAPQARISEIGAEIVQAISAAAALVDGPIRLTGHSAGGQLAARVAVGEMLPDAVRARLKAVVPISPVSDLRPLRETSMNADLRLDEAEAVAESPTLLAPPDVAVSVWVGAEERPVFLDQARWLAQAWNAEHVEVPARHHFDVIDELRDADSTLVNTILA
ncbi:MAG: alpha/beta hydrolase [Paracoccaceae bacterium]